MDLNKAMIIGRLTRDPEMRTTPNGINVCTFSIATNSNFGQGKDVVEYHNIVIWRKLAEIANQYLKKGSQVYIEGRLQTRSWDDQATGKKNYRTEIVTSEMIMLGGKPGGSSGSNSASGGSSAFGSAGGASSNDSESNKDSEFISSSDIPTINQEPADEEITVEDIPF